MTDKHSVTITLERNEVDTEIVKLVFDGDIDDPVYYQSTKLLTTYQSELKNLKRKNGKAPRASDMMALLNCDGGSLEFLEQGVWETYRIEVKTRKAPVNVVDQESKIDFMYATMKEQKKDAATIPISNPGRTHYDRAIKTIGIKLSAPEWKEKPTGLEDLASRMASHTWLPGKEDSEQNRKNYMAYLNDKNKIILPANGKLFEGSSVADLLSAEFSDYGIKVNGNIDVTLAPHYHQRVQTTRQNMWAGIELKKEENKENEKIERQLILQHLCASYLNEDTGILTIMTDLCTRWHFYWFSKDKAALMSYYASKGEAKYLIRNMMEENPSDTSPFPTDYLNRASWNEMFNEIPHSNREDNMQRNHTVYATQSFSGHGGNDRITHERVGSDQVNQNGMSENMDFLDEEEERGAMFRQILHHSLPRMLYFPQPMEEQKQNSKSPPKNVLIS